MPSIELEGHSEARFVLKDGKIIRVEERPDMKSFGEAPRGPDRR